jgi:serine phosphatase RsbU (regulator of sigma subunit)/lipopolysaccharide biosynthesis regulator YciM
MRPYFSLMGRKLLFVLLFSLLAQPAAGQSPVLDSLERVLANKSLHDTLRVATLALLAEHVVSSFPEKTKRYVDEALAISQRIGFVQGQANSYRVLSTYYRIQSDYGKSLEYGIQSLKLFEQLGHLPDVARIYVAMGEVLRTQNNRTEATAYFEKALEIFNQLNANGLYSRDCADITRKFGEMSLLAREYEQAEEWLVKALAMEKAIPNEAGVAKCLVVLGSFYESQKQYDKALRTYQEALQTKLATRNPSSLTVYYCYVGGVYLNMAQYDSALHYLNLGLKWADEAQINAMRSFSHQRLVRFYEATNNYRKAFEHYRMHIAIKDSAFNAESTKKIANIQAAFGLEKKQAEIELLNAAKAKDDIVRYSLMAGLGLFALLAFIVYRAWVGSRKANALLQRQAQEIAAKNEELKLQKEEILVQSENLRQLNEEIVATNDTLERQNGEIFAKNEELEHKGQMITDSIRYAKDIQQAVFPFSERMAKSIPGHFIFWKPKDIVSGDFYWFTVKNQVVYLAVADCTGHGVPGAFMSMIGTNFLGYIVNERDILAPKDILAELHDSIRLALKQEEGHNADGMDIGIVAIDARQLVFAGAKSTLVMVRQGELQAIKGDRQSVGGMNRANRCVFHETVIPREEAAGATFYLSSDGFPDQLGGPDGKRLMSPAFQQMLLQASALPMAQQRDWLDRQLQDWMQGHEQVDDILVFGFQI